MGPARLLLVAFGLWWMLFPDSVLRFHRRFYGRHYDASRMDAKPVAIRIIGAVWLTLLFVSWWTAGARN